MRNRGFGRVRMFVGGFLLAAAIITWGTTFMMSPHESGVAGADTEHIRTTVVTFVRNSAIGTLILSAIAGWLLFPARRPRWPARDYVLIAVLAILIASSMYQLFWVRTLVAG